MRRGMKILATGIIFLLIVAVGGVLYIDYWLGDMLSKAAPNLGITSNLEGGHPDTNQPVASDDKEKAVDPEVSSSIKTDNENASANTNTPAQTNNGNNTPVAKEQTKPVTPSSADKSTPSSKQPEAIPASNNAIASAIQQEVGQVASVDLIKAGFIVLSKLSKDEIDFLFGFSDKSYSKNELIQAREILLSKLNAEDVKTLRSLARKYGRTLDILDPTVEIK